MSSEGAADGDAEKATGDLGPEPEPSLSAILLALGRLCEPGSIYELRAPNTRRGTVSGYFDDIGALAKFAVQVNEPQLEAAGVYFTANPIDPALLARSANRVQSYARHTSSDTDILRRCRLIIDLDPTRAPGISATNQQHDAALCRAQEVHEYLARRGWPAPIVVDSGNGAHLLFRIELPNDADATVLVKRVLGALALLFDDDEVTVDRTCFNAARIIKIPGTVARKGYHDPARPHRVSRVIETGGDEIVSREQLEHLVAIIPETKTCPPELRHLGLEAWISAHCIAVKRILPWNGGRRFILKHCLFDSSHTGSSAALIELANGAKVYKCLHNTCVDRKWADVRALFEGQSKGGSKEGPSVEDGWLEPIPLDVPMLPSLPSEIFPRWAEDHIDAIAAATETPRELAAMMELGVIATAVQRKFVVEVQRGYIEPLNLWSIPALPSGHRKTQVHQAVTQPLRQWEKEQLAEIAPRIAKAQSEKETALVRIAGLRKRAGATATPRSKNSKTDDDPVDYADLQRQIEELESQLPEVPTVPKLWTQDVTPERLGALMLENREAMGLISDEGGIFDILAGRYSNGVPNLDLFLQSHAGAPVRVDRSSRPSVVMDSPALSLVLSPQPDVLQGLAAKPGFRGRGLLARFLFMLPVSKIGYRSGNTKPVPETISSDHDAHIRALLRFKRPEAEPHTIVLSDEAYTEWREFGALVEASMREGGRFEQFQDWAGKLPGAAARIAGCLHVAGHAFENPTDVMLSITTMQRALEFAAVLSEHALAAFDLMGADVALKDARKVWSWIQRERKPQFTFRDCFDALRGTFPRTADLERPIEVLVERHHIALVKWPPRAGRPSRVYEVNPKLTVRWGA